MDLTGWSAACCSVGVDGMHTAQHIACSHTVVTAMLVLRLLTSMLLPVTYSM